MTAGGAAAENIAWTQVQLGNLRFGAGRIAEAETAYNAALLAYLQELKPELTTLDITMPEKDGLAALKEIIELDPSARVIMCSALGQESKVLESIKLGAEDFVVKPFQPDRVLEALAKALA